MKIEIIARISRNGKTTKETTLLPLEEGNLAGKYLDCQTQCYPGLKIHLYEHWVLKNNQDVLLSRYEYGILSFMARHPVTLFSKEQIFVEVWSENSDSCLSAITNTIGLTRQKIEDDKTNPVYIRTVSNLGYIFAAKPVEFPGWFMTRL